MPGYAPRITLPWSDISGVAPIWAGHCKEIIVYQHDADLSVKATHCHFLMLECSIKAEQFKRLFRKLYPDISGSGNGFWKWENKDWPNPTIDSITYMHKAKYPYLYKNNISDKIVENLQGLAFQPKLQNAETSATKKEKTETQMTHFELIEKLWIQLQSDDKVTRQVCTSRGEIAREIFNHSLAFDALNRMLNRNKIRTSRNELERFYVTLLRQDASSTKKLKDAILGNVFRGLEL